MSLDPAQALQHIVAAPPSVRSSAVGPLWLLGGAGTLGSEFLAQALARGSVQVATVAPLRVAMSGLKASLMPVTFPGGALDDVEPTHRATQALVVFDRARGNRGREDAFFQPEPAQLLPLARWLHQQGVRSLAVVQPHAPALLPAALRQGLASLDEQAVAALGFDRLLLVRPTQFAERRSGLGRIERFAQWWLSQLALMLPEREKPLRAQHVAAFTLEALARWPRDAPGTRVAGAEALWRAAQPGGAAAAVSAWLMPRADAAI
jgi:hypothetical protein